MSSILNSASGGGTGASSGGPGLVKHVKFYHEIVVFQIEDTLYHVVKQGLEKHSRSVFRDMFALPQGEQLDKEGTTDENPIKLPGCTNLEFESLLEVIYPVSGLIGSPELSKEQWIGVLKLSRLWDMPEVAALAIDKLSLCQLTPMEKISLGKAHGVSSWLKEGYTSLVADLTNTSLPDISALGWETAFRIAWAHIQATIKHPSFDSTNIVCYYCRANKKISQTLTTLRSPCSACGTTLDGWSKGSFAIVAIPTAATLSTETLSTQVAIQEVLEAFDEELKEAERRNA